MLDYEPALSYEHEVYPYSHAGNSEGAGGMSENIFVGEYTVLEQLHIFGGFMDTFSVLYPQFQDVDFRTQATTLHVPGYVPGRGPPRGTTFRNYQLRNTPNSITLRPDPQQRVGPHVRVSVGAAAPRWSR